MDLRELKELLEIISERDISEFELEEEGVKLKIRRAGPAAAMPAVSLTAESNNHHPSGLAPVSTAPALAPPPGAVPAVQPEPVPDPTISIIRSPMVGTFYRAPEPNAPPFVNVGDRIKPGQVLCIIEAMKLMNEIEAEQAGEILKILVENGQPVQYGDELFAIRAAM